MNKLSDVRFGRKINTRIQTYFKNLNLHTVEDVVNYPLQDLVKIKGFGMIAYTCVWCTIDEKFPEIEKEKFCVWWDQD